MYWYFLCKFLNRKENRVQVLWNVVWVLSSRLTQCCDLGTKVFTKCIHHLRAQF